MSRAGGFPPVFLTGLPIIQVNVLRTYTPTQIMYPPCDNDSCETTNLVISVALRLFQGVHDLCRYPTLFVKYTILSYSFILEIDNIQNYVSDKNRYLHK